ncbi:MerR family transcriptional regulator [Luteipulveratus sp. YIM 133132]|uniref:MerR family transcriptional regulator n=1 Tax=Luteipulveratus flavus TaxID=3031728 RepID=UPI0023AF5519|nr:MerR family transcriptional regulator [Luteipulveratus sp. YIM 133132]MDE9367833.1 MerR family transcriptional regulator [Luteipulveratus sp. YIM 133132]
MSELSAATGAPVATLKFYLREGVLHPGESLSRTQARYDESHVERVRLIRALMDTGGLSMAATRSVLAAVDDPPPERHELLGVAARALTGDTAPVSDPELTERTWSWIHERGWHIAPDETLVARLTNQVEAARSAGIDVTWERLGRYADAMDRVADADIASVPADRGEALRYVVVGTVMVDPVLQTLRRLAHQNRSAGSVGKGGPQPRPAATAAVSSSPDQRPETPGQPAR